MNWDEIRTAFHVAKAGTVSGAAEALGVHHATVIRHIDALEAALGAKLFQRHARGYTPTEAGRDLLRVATVTDDQFTQLAGRLKGQGDDVSGELNVTTVAGIAPLLMPALARLQADHPALRIGYFSDSRLYRLEYGEAHVAIRAGVRPADPDNVVQPFMMLPVRLCASRAYADAHGLPSGPDDFAGHRFVGAEPGARPPSAQWLEAHVAPDQYVLRSPEIFAARQAVRLGMGIGFVAGTDLPDDDLVEIMPPLPDWPAPLWLVTHVDLHRTPKVQLACAYLKEASTQIESLMK